MHKLSSIHVASAEPSLPFLPYVIHFSFTSLPSCPRVGVRPTLHYFLPFSRLLPSVSPAVTLSSFMGQGKYMHYILSRSHAYVSITHTMTAGARARMQTSDIHTGVLFNLDLERTERTYAVCSPQSTHLCIFAYTRRCLLFVHEATNLRSLCAPILTPFTCDLNTLLIQHAFPTLVCVLLFQGCW